MLPIKLIIEGLYSYQERQTIDFSDLTKVGLFGIFGKVGSGKSSILEAITYALFGNSDRLGSSNMGYNMMNLKSNRSYVEFEFQNYQNRLFKITREYRRNSKTFNKITNTGVVLYEYFPDGWTPLESSNVEHIIGLSSENFRRTIIIPQGKFKEFIELKPTERTQMMKDIFNLDKYDLYDKAAVMHRQNQTERDLLEGRLANYDAISIEKIEELKSILDQEKINLSDINQRYEQISAQFQQLSVLKADFELLDTKRKFFSKLEEQYPIFEQKAEELRHYQQTYKIFNDLLRAQKSDQLQFNTLQKHVTDATNSLDIWQKKSDDLKAQMAFIQPKVDKLPHQKQIENDYTVLLSIKENEIKIAKNEQSTIDGKRFVEEWTEKTRISKAHINQLELKINALKSNLVPNNIILSVSEWFSNYQFLNRNLEAQRINFEQYSTIIQQRRLALKAFTDQDIPQQMDQLIEQKEQLILQKNKLEVSGQLAHYSNTLTDGDPCPLCGSAHHPSIAVFHNLYEDLNNTESQIKRVEQLLAELDLKKLEVQGLMQEIDLIAQQEKNYKQGIVDLETQKSKMLDSFAWDLFSPNDFEHFQQIKQQNIVSEEKIQSDEKQLSQYRQNLESTLLKLEKATLRFQEIENENIRFASAIESNQRHLKNIKFNDYKHISFDELQHMLQELQQDNRNIEDNAQRLNKELTEVAISLASDNAKLEQLRKQETDLTTKIQYSEKEINKLLYDNRYDSLNQVQGILSLQLNEGQIQEEIQQFHIKYGTLKNEINNLEDKLRGINFNPEEFQRKKDQLQEISDASKEKNETVIRLQADIERHIKSFEEKRELIEQKSVLDKENENLKTMLNLFKGAGFVQYVSSIYLRQLCDNANIRFHRMSNNQLSLSLSESNEFEIIDYLNEGKSRSVRTLSGGQSFQVSLSLALALAESVQSNAIADKNFFFIDEGFGTQDIESINIIFETLLSLQKEDRIVGIISHVEELKERIPIHLNISQDQERGSQIRLN